MLRAIVTAGAFLIAGLAVQMLSAVLGCPIWLHAGFGAAWYTTVCGMLAWHKRDGFQLAQENRTLRLQVAGWNELMREKLADELTAVLGHLEMIEPDLDATGVQARRNKALAAARRMRTELLTMTLPSRPPGDPPAASPGPVS
jgi:hypothetical protein